MKNNMKIKKSLSALFILVLVFGVVSVVNRVFAGPYTGPTGFSFPDCPSTTPGCNTPVNIGSQQQVKTGPLAVTAFLASGNSEFAQDVSVDELAGSNPDRTVCADTNGKLVFCNMPGSVFVSANYNMSLLVSGITGFSQSSPTSGNYTGTHTAFTGEVAFTPTWTAGNLPPNGVIIELLKNNAALDCHTILDGHSPNGSIYYFHSATFALSDSIAVEAITTSGSVVTPNNTCTD
jgi:hypothetical protein